MSPRRARAVSGRVGDDPATALREHLIDAAERLLAQTPISSITTREIARTAGVSDGVLYNYFADKDDLVLAALLRRYRTITERFSTRLPEAGSGTLEGNLGAIAGALFELAADVIPMIAGLLSDPPLFHRLFEAMHQEPLGPQLLGEPLAKYLEEEQRLGRVSPDVDPRAVAWLLLGPTAMVALASQMGRVQGSIDLPEQLRQMVAALMTGLRPD
ncbi:MAG: TetR/AcrR family transcriptional regulator [Candidatus Limnocylindrales bacterium]